MDFNAPLRVLVAGPNFHYFNQSITRAFSQLGCEVRCVAYDTPVHPYNRLNQVRYKCCTDREALLQASSLRYEREVEEVFDAFRPHLLFVINGELLPTSALMRMRQHARVALWLFDSLVRIPRAGQNLQAAHHIFCYEREDVDLIARQWGLPATFLPQAADPVLYHPMEGVVRDLDISFVGDIFVSHRRQQLLQSVVRNFPEARIEIWGRYKPWFKGLWTCLTREHRDIYTNRNAPAEVVNRVYNRSKVVVNIHHEQQRNGANPKVFEIAAAGAYQVVDDNPFIASLFPHGEVGLYHNETELLDAIAYGLKQNCEEQARAACSVVLEGHTFVARMKTVLAEVAHYNNNK